MALNFSLITPTGKIYDNIEIKQLTVKTTDGEMTVLENHAPIVSSLKSGDLKVVLNNDTKIFYLERGIVKIEAKHVKILAEGYEEKKQ